MYKKSAIFLFSSVFIPISWKPAGTSGLTKLFSVKNTKTIISNALILFVLCSSGLCLAAEQQIIKARYKNPRGTDISWKIKIPSPPPAAVIVLQFIPPGTRILNSSPAFHSYDPESGTVKWLLSGVRPGLVTMKMTLNQPIRKKGEISGKIIFQDTSTKPISSTFISSPNKSTRKRAIEGC